MKYLFREIFKECRNIQKTTGWGIRSFVELITVYYKIMELCSDALPL